MGNNHNANLMVKNQRCVRVGREVWFWVGGFEEEESDLDSRVCLGVSAQLSTGKKEHVSKRATVYCEN